MKRSSIRNWKKKYVVKLFNFLFLMLFAVSTYSQKAKIIKVKKTLHDTINYKVFPDGYDLKYRLMEIKPPAKGNPYQLNHLFFFMVLDQSQEISIYNNQAGSTIPVKVNDTIINWSWDIHHNDLSVHKFFFGKITLNQRTNALTVVQEIGKLRISIKSWGENKKKDSFG